MGLNDSCDHLHPVSRLEKCVGSSWSLKRECKIRAFERIFTEYEALNWASSSMDGDGYDGIMNGREGRIFSKCWKTD